MTRTLVLLLEEPSAQAMLEGLLPRVLPLGMELRFVVFEGKQDLEKQLERRLSLWQAPNSLFVVLRDQDAGDCRKIKGQLSAKCAAAGREDALVRIACRELVSWYLGDLAAVEEAFCQRGLARLALKAKYKQPDLLGSPSAELEALTRGQYQKVEGSRKLGPLLNLEGNLSHSFQVFGSKERLCDAATPLVGGTQLWVGGPVQALSRAYERLASTLTGMHGLACSMLPSLFGSS